MDLEHERRLTEVEQRAKSNSHRLEKLEPIVEEIHTMTNTMVQLVQEVKHTNEAVDNLGEKVDRIDGRVDEMEKTPAKKWDSMKNKIFDVVLGLIVGFFVAGFIWAAVQAF